MRRAAAFLTCCACLASACSVEPDGSVAVQPPAGATAAESQDAPASAEAVGGRGVGSDGTTVTIDGVTVSAPAGSEVEVTRESEQDQRGPARSSASVARGTGAGLSTSAAEQAAQFDASAPESELGGGGAGGGGGGRSKGGGSSLTATLRGAAGFGAFGWIGIACLLGAAAALYFRLGLRAVVTLGVVGAAFMLAELLPEGAVLAICGGVVIAAGVYVWAEFSAKRATAKAKAQEAEAQRQREAVRAVAAGVEDLPPPVRLLTKAAIASHASEQDTLTIRAVKRGDGLPSERPGTVIGAGGGDT